MIRPPPRSPPFPSTPLSRSQTEKVRRQIRQGPSQGNVVIYVQAARRWIDPPGLRDGLRAHGLAAFRGRLAWTPVRRSEEHTSELQSQSNLVCRLLLEKKKKQ